MQGVSWCLWSCRYALSHAHSHVIFNASQYTVILVDKACMMLARQSVLVSSSRHVKFYKTIVCGFQCCTTAINVARCPLVDSVTSLRLADDKSRLYVLQRKFWCAKLSMTTAVYCAATQTKPVCCVAILICESLLDNVWLLWWMSRFRCLLQQLHMCNLESDMVSWRYVA